MPCWHHFGNGMTQYGKLKCNKNTFLKVVKIMFVFKYMLF